MCVYILNYSNTKDKFNDAVLFKKDFIKYKTLFSELKFKTVFFLIQIFK